jgi:hypothetical protein
MEGCGRDSVPERPSYIEYPLPRYPSTLGSVLSAAASARVDCLMESVLTARVVKRSSER